MPIVSQGNSVVVDVGAHDGLWVKSTGRAEVTVNQVYAGTPEVISVTSETVRVGFYGESVTVSIRAVSGSADYQDTPYAYEKLTATQQGDRSDSSALDIAQAVNNLQSGTVGFDAITLKGLPNTPGAPAGYGDVADAILNSATVLDGVKELSDDISGAQFVKNFYSSGAGDSSVFLYASAVQKSQHDGISIISPEALSAWDGTLANISQLLSWSGTGSGCFVRQSGFGASKSGAVKSSSGVGDDSSAVLQRMSNLDSVIDNESYFRARYNIGSSIKYQSEGGLNGRSDSFNGTLIKPLGDFPVVESLNTANAYTRYRLNNVMLECDNQINAYAINLVNAFLFNFENVWLRNSTKGVSIVGCDSINFYNLKAMETQKGEGVFIGDSSRSIRFTNSNFETSVALAKSGAGDVNINGGGQTVTEASFAACQFERTFLNVTSGVASVDGGSKFADAGIKLLSGSQKCSIQATCYGTTTYHDVGMLNSATNLSCMNASTSVAKWPQIIDNSATASTAMVVGAVNDEIILLASLVNLRNTALTGATVSLNDGATALDTSSAINLPASLNSTGTSTRQSRTALLVGKATTVAPTVVITGNASFGAVAGGKNLLTNGLFITDVSGWTGNTSALSWSAGKMVVTPSGSNWGAWQNIDAKCKNGKNYIAIAKYSGTADFVLGNSWDGSAGARTAVDGGIDGYFADGDKLAMLFFTYYRGYSQRLSIGRIGNNTPISVDWVFLIEA